jgi:Bacterial TSP3 repeat
MLRVGALLAAVLLACSDEPAPRDAQDLSVRDPDAGGYARFDSGVPIGPKDAAQSSGASDSDGDGLSDAYERAHGLDPNDADSDGDGVTDLAEVVAGTDGADATSHPMARGDFYFIVPYRAPPSPERATLAFATGLQATDLVILMDTTGTMGPAIAQVRDKLSTRIVPQASALVGDLRIGVAHFDDIPDSFHGDRNDVVLAVDQIVTSDLMAAQRAVEALDAAGGADLPEGAVPALYSLATGFGLGSYLADATACADGGLGYACLRPNAVPIILLVSDAELHNGPGGVNPYPTSVMPTPPLYEDAIAALGDVGAHVISVLLYGDGSTALPSDYPAAQQMMQLSQDTGAIAVDGKPFFFSVPNDATSLDGRIVDAVRGIANEVPVDVTVVLRDDPSDTVDAAALIDRIEANTAGGVPDPREPSRICASGHKAVDTDNDGVLDTFVDVLPGTPVCFDVIARTNDTIPSGGTPALHKALLDVVADGRSVLDTREVYFLVPPAEPIVE